MIRRSVLTAVVCFGLAVPAIAPAAFRQRLEAALPRREARSAASKRVQPTVNPKVVAIDAGHGGRDLGAVAGGRREKELVLALSRRVQKHMARMPELSPYLTRWSDEFVPLTDRVLRAEQVGSKAFVSLHIDNVRGRKGRGVIIYVYGRNRKIPNGPPRAYGEKKLPPPPRSQVRASRRLAGFIRRGLKDNGIKTVRYVDIGGFAVLKSPDTPSVLVEVGNLRDKAEAKNLSSARYQDKLAAALTHGIRKFLASTESRVTSSR